MDLIHNIVQIYQNYRFKTQILAASLRSPTHVVESALAGAHIGTMPFKVLDMLFNHPLTDKGLEQFLEGLGKGLSGDAGRGLTNEIAGESAGPFPVGRRRDCLPQQWQSPLSAFTDTVRGAALALRPRSANAAAARCWWRPAKWATPTWWRFATTCSSTPTWSAAWIHGLAGHHSPQSQPAPGPLVSAARRRALRSAQSRQLHHRGRRVERTSAGRVLPQVIHVPM